MDHGSDFRFRRYNRKCDFRPTSIKLTSFSRSWLNRFGQSWARLKAEMWPQIKCAWIMMATSSFGDIIGNVIFMPTSIKLTSFSRRWLYRFQQSWARLKAEMWSQIKFKCTMAPTSSSGDMIEKVTYMPTFPGERNRSTEPL